MLDAFRGIAALAVVIHHVIGASVPALRIGQPAVIVFFVISGYCIAAAATACWRQGFGLAEFMLRRLRRIYPPYLLSLLLWAASRHLKTALGFGETTHSWLQWIQNITLTQWLSLLEHPANYPSQNPSLFVAAYWSLNYEEQFYLVVGLAMVAAQAGMISMQRSIVFLTVISLVWIAENPALCYGIFIEYWAMFSVGCLVFYRLCIAGRRLWVRTIDSSLLLVLFGSIVLRLYDPRDAIPATWLGWIQAQGRSAWGDLAVASGFGLVLISLRPFNDLYNRVKWIRAPLGGLGAITYSLYLIHQFNLGFVQHIFTKSMAFLNVENPSLIFAAGFQCAGHILLACGFWYFCERPFLNRPLTTSLSVSAGTPRE